MGIDLMIKDIYKLTNENADYISLIKDVEELKLFDDTFLDSITNPLFKNHYLDNPEAKSIIKKINDRDLYKFIGEIYVTEGLNCDKITISEFLKCSKSNLNEENVILKRFSLSYGNGNEDPMNSVSFYKNKTNHLTELNKDLHFMDRPAKFKEEIIRVYVKDGNLFNDTLFAFKKFCKEIGLISHEYKKTMSSKKHKKTTESIDFTISPYLQEKVYKNEGKICSNLVNLENNNLDLQENKN